MFSAKKKSFPAGTFIATPLRILAIVQLCMAFTVLASYAGYPFMGELFEIKSRKMLYESVMGRQDEDVKRRFTQLPEVEKSRLEEQYMELQNSLDKPFVEKLKSSIKKVFQIPPFEKAWLAFSIVISLLLLLRIEGAALAAWVLPLIVFAYGMDSRGAGQTTSDAALFPSEEVIVAEYLKEPLSPEILEQREQLLRGWHLYLVREWAGETPSSDPSAFQAQLKEAEFKFNLARLGAISSSKPDDVNGGHTSFLLLVVYFGWNLFFAWFMNRKITV